MINGYKHYKGKHKVFDILGRLERVSVQGQYLPSLSLLLEETGYEKRQTPMIKTTVLQFMLEVP